MARAGLPAIRLAGGNIADDNAACANHTIRANGNAFTDTAADSNPTARPDTYSPCQMSTWGDVDAVFNEIVVVKPNSTCSGLRLRSTTAEALIATRAMTTEPGPICDSSETALGGMFQHRNAQSLHGKVPKCKARRAVLSPMAANT